MARKKRWTLDPSKFTFTVRFVPPPACPELQLHNTTNPDMERIATAISDLPGAIPAAERDGAAPVTPSPPQDVKPKKGRRLAPRKFTIRLVPPGTYPDLEPNPDNPYTMLPDESRMKLLKEDLTTLLQEAARG